MERVTTIGIVGGGQLGRMLTLAALPLGFQVVVVDPTPHSPAAQVGAKEITADLYNEAALRKLAKLSDYITVEIEHLDTDVLEKIAKLGRPINPAPATIRLIQDKFKQKEFLHKAGIAVAPFVPISNAAEAKAALKKFKGKMLLKTRLGAYDGRGNMVVTSQKDVDQALSKFGDTPLYAEAFIPFKKELAIMVARSLKGEVALYPVVQTKHERNICVEVIAPAPITQAEKKAAERLALKVAKHLKGAGVFGIEMFLTKDGKVLANEIAPRVHNSGHYTIEANRTSQFEQHIRAISGLPLGATDLITPAAVMINILGERNGPVQLRGIDAVLKLPHTSLHLYGKSPTKIDRKMGHITSTAATHTQALTRARQARRKVQI